MGLTRDEAEAAVRHETVGAERGGLLGYISRLTEAELQGMRVDVQDGAEAVVEFIRDRKQQGAAVAGAAPAADPGQTELRKRLRNVEEFVELSAKRQKYSVTLAKHIGESILESTDTTISCSEMLGHHLIRALPKALGKKFKKKWRNATNEEKLQPLLFEAMQAMCKEHEVLDTHKANFYKAPTAKIDIALSASPQALWATLVSALELKKTLVPAESYQDGIGQLFDRWEKVQEAQPDRQHMTSCVMGKDSIQLWRFGKKGGHTRTPLLPFTWKEDDLGYQALLSFVNTPALMLGFVAWQIPTLFTTSTGARVTCLIQLAGRAALRPVFKANYSVKKRRGVRVVMDVIVKLCKQSDADKEAAVLQQFSGRRGFPDLLAHGRLPANVARQTGLSHFLVISPVGVHLGDDLSEDAMCVVLRDVAGAIKQLADEGFLHRDLSPSNIIVAKRGCVEQGVLLDFHVAARMGDKPPGASVTGKVLYHALRLLDTRQHSVGADLESLFYSLLDVASCGQALSWRHSLTDRQLYDSKFTVMFSPSKWQSVLTRCTAALRPLVQRLHRAVFRSGTHEYFNTPAVSVEEFLAALPVPAAAQ